MNLRPIMKKAAYRSGALSAFHSRQNRNVLTALMFHRVLAEEDIRATGADPLYTVTPEFLSDCINFVRGHYALVGLQDVLHASDGVKPLPDSAAIITFDDGWRDNLTEAAPVLSGTPWTIFVSSDAASETGYWWQEVLLWAQRSGVATSEELWRNISLDRQSPYECGSHALLIRYGQVPDEVRNHALAPYEAELHRRNVPRHMLTRGELMALHKAGVSIGGHGASHLPLNLLPDPMADIGRCREVLLNCVGPASALSMSFPHGRYNDCVLKAAHALSYRLLFTSDPVLNLCPGGRLQSNLVGRIPITTKEVGDESGRFSPEKMATWLFLRDRCVLAGTAE
ncbi:MAG TPA: polysaccharide deacetylase family protein [Rhizomicrobium sp.]|nr:polysaccharide deacetylase family protein [Rhizomicrobium sp.]